MKRFTLSYLCLLLMIGSAYCQVTIGADKSPEDFSVLELISNNDKGFRLPQLTSLQRDRMTDENFRANTRALGLMIFNLSSRSVEIWNGTTWVTLGDNHSEGKTIWRILWAICPVIDATVNGVRYQTTMTEEEINLVKLKATWFEEFVEKYTHNKLDIQVTVDVIRNPITTLNPATDNNVYGFPLPEEDRFRLRPEDNFDGVILTADYTGIPKTWMGITASSQRTSWVVFCRSGCGDMTYGGADPNLEIKRLHTDVYVHEWLHQVEWYFPTLGSGYETPVLHNSATEYQYTPANTGLSGEALLEKWYIDYLQGSIVEYAGATGACKGIHPDWWQYSPSYWKNTVATSPANYSKNVPVSPTFTIKWESPVTQTYSTGNYHVVLRDGATNEELGFYRVTQLMNADKQELTIDFGKPLYKMWDNVNVVVNFERGKTYRLTSYLLEYSSPPTIPSHSDANFSILFEIAP